MLLILLLISRETVLILNSCNVSFEISQMTPLKCIILIYEPVHLLIIILTVVNFKSWMQLLLHSLCFFSLNLNKKKRSSSMHSPKNKIKSVIHAFKKTKQKQRQQQRTFPGRFGAGQLIPYTFSSAFSRNTLSLPAVCEPPIPFCFLRLAFSTWRVLYRHPLGFGPTANQSGWNVHSSVSVAEEGRDLTGCLKFTFTVTRSSWCKKILFFFF